MAVIHRAEVRPTKLELLEEWLPSQSWAASAGEGPLESVGAFRFDDPQGEVGIETLLVRRGDGPVLQVPLTYRGSPLAGAESALIGTMEHSVLGARWVYDGLGDPVYVTAVLHAMLTGGRQADEVVETEDGPVPRESSASAFGSGRADDAVAPVGQPEVRRVLAGADPDADAAATLRGRWRGQDSDVVLVTV